MVCKAAHERHIQPFDRMYNAPKWWRENLQTGWWLDDFRLRLLLYLGINAITTRPASGTKGLCKHLFNLRQII